MKHSHWIKTISKGIGLLLGILLVIVVGYVIYMQLQYYRIPDHQTITTKNDQSKTIQLDHPYTAMTYNIGFGAYSPSYSFFMDTGESLKGEKTQGKYSRAYSKAEEEKNTNGSIQTVQKIDPDFAFIQEIDEKATRSYGVNQLQLFEQNLNQYGVAYAKDFHTAYLFYPFTEPHGAVQGGIVTFSKYHIQSNERRQFPVSSAFIEKFMDLDRCFLVSHMPVSNGKELMMINLHMSAYDKGGKSREAQLKLLNQVMQDEAQKGNYVIVGGDFNHSLGDSIHQFPTQQKTPDWVYELKDSDITSGFRFVKATNATTVPTCRATDIPYEPGYSYTTVVDGFLVSDNVQATAENQDNGFAYADHNPVKLTFTLKK
ncbi:MAG: endonuclease/exonuclease/phosphatase family protein [Aerococcus sp.]|nr:endonuclease/exonuclease/phosphatase family protein [Aerococcus sp.]